MGGYIKRPDLVSYLKGQEREKSQLHQPSSPRVSLLGSQSISHDTLTSIVWSTVLDDRFGMWSSALPGRVAIPKAGLYLFTIEAHWATNATGYRSIEVGSDSGDTRDAVSDASVQTRQTVSWQRRFNSSVGYSVAGAQQTCGAPLTLVTTLTVSFVGT